MAEKKTAPQEQGADTVICQQCGTINNSDANFCKNCAKKLRKVCNCWVKKGMYDCGLEKCPGIGLLIDIN